MSNAASLLTRTSIRFVLALLGGSVAYLAFPRQGIWALTFVSVAAIYLSARGARGKAVLPIGFVAGFTFFASQTTWLSLYLGPAPLLALATLEGLIFALFFGGFVRVQRLVAGKTLWLAALFSSFWVAREWFSGNYPYGGFPWGKLVTSQAETTLANWVWLGGMPLADLAIVFTTVVIVEYLFKPQAKSILFYAVASVLLLVAVPLFITPGTASEAGKITIAAVQGNANAGLFSNRESGKMLQNHIDATNALLATGATPELIVWPENAVDLDVMGNETNRAKMAAFVNRIQTPVAFGTVTRRDALYNTSVLWLPGQGPVDWYDKQYPVPFAEYVPNRPFWNALAPDLIGLLPYDFASGTRDGIYELGRSKLGTLICFEIAVDDVPRELVNRGAELILSQTNNADFGHSDEAFQQLAIAKLKAIESGRSLVNISTVGPSSMFLPNGKEVSYLKEFTAASMIYELPLRTSVTPAIYVARPLEFAVVAISLFAFASSFFRTKRGRGVV